MHDSSDSTLTEIRTKSSTTADTEGRTKSSINGPKLRPPLSVGDPKQFILSGSIGDRRVRVLVDTGIIALIVEGKGSIANYASI